MDVETHADLRRGYASESVCSYTCAHTLPLSGSYSLTLKPLWPRPCHAGVAGAEGYHPSGYSPQWHTSLLNR